MEHTAGWPELFSPSAPPPGKRSQVMATPHQGTGQRWCPQTVGCHGTETATPTGQTNVWQTGQKLQHKLHKQDKWMYHKQDKSCNTSYTNRIKTATWRGQNLQQKQDKTATQKQIKKTATVTDTRPTLKHKQEVWMQCTFRHGALQNVYRTII